MSESSGGGFLVPAQFGDRIVSNTAGSIRFHVLDSDPVPLFIAGTTEVLFEPIDLSHLPDESRLFKLLIAYAELRLGKKVSPKLHWQILNAVMESGWSNVNVGYTSSCRSAGRMVEGRPAGSQGGECVGG